jgi:hypothetical protein
LGIGMSRVDNSMSGDGGMLNKERVTGMIILIGLFYLIRNRRGISSKYFVFISPVVDAAKRDVMVIKIL